MWGGFCAYDGGAYHADQHVRREVLDLDVQLREPRPLTALPLVPRAGELGDIPSELGDEEVGHVVGGQLLLQGEEGGGFDRAGTDRRRVGACAALPIGHALATHR